MTAILKYNAGNVQSVQFALERLGESSILTDDPAALRQARRVIFPGVGEAASAMAYLHSRGLDEVLLSLQQPVLGICLGMQLFCRYSEENDTNCLGIFDTEVKLFQPDEQNQHLKVPHMGWNTLEQLQGPLFEGIPEQSWVYFVHSYYASLAPQQTAATCHYGHPFAAALQKDNFYGVQFHPEKSGAAGQRILENFLRM